MGTSDQIPLPREGESNRRFDESGQLIADINCVECAYNLRGLYLDKTCPECGHLIGDSARSNLLQYSDLDWLYQLMLGVYWFRGALIAQIFVPIALFRWSSTFYMVLIGLAQVGVLSGFALGFWWFTSPEPNPREKPDGSDKRLGARITLVGGMSLMAVTLASFVLLIFLAEPGGYIWMGDLISPAADLASLLFFGGAISICIGFLLACTYARDLAKRIPDPNLEKNCTRTMWILYATYGSVILITSIMYINRNVGGSDALSILTLLVGGGLAILAIILIYRAITGAARFFGHFKTLVQGREPRLANVSK